MIISVKSQKYKKTVNINKILSMSPTYPTVKPFLKWAGGKTQILPYITNALPEELFTGNMPYIEPFVGSGALFFWIVSNIPNLKKIIINDINPELMNTYKTIKYNVLDLIHILSKWEKEYHALEGNDDEKKAYYIEKRLLFNKKTSDAITQSALFIFLNRTCFNGLYRVNKKGEFNVPMGRYKRPKICDKENLLNINKVLKRVEILNEDFEDVLAYVNEKSFFYFDPPYKPISSTSSFTSYFDKFDDQEQIRLKLFCDILNKKGHLWMLSNSDVRDKNKTAGFFDKLYSGYNIVRVSARRSINSNPEKRGEITELLITNYTHRLIDKNKI